VSTPPTTPALTAQYTRIVEDLTYHYDGVFSRETVQLAVEKARDTLGPVAKFPSFLPILTQRFARDQLLAAAQAEGNIATTVPEILFVCVHNAGRSQMPRPWPSTCPPERSTSAPPAHSPTNRSAP